jgi:hypothetical protein
MPTNNITPTKQGIYINSSQGRMFDFNTPDSRVYLGEAVNSLLRVFGNDVIITGFRILNISYNSNDIINVTISPGEAILDNTLVKYTETANLSIDVSGLDDNGILIPNIFFKFITTQQKNLSSIRLNYVTTSGNVPESNWFTEYSHLILAVLRFNKQTKTITKDIIPILDRPKINIEDKEYTVYPTDNISKRVLLYLNESLN